LLGPFCMAESLNPGSSRRNGTTVKVSVFVNNSLILWASLFLPLDYSSDSPEIWQLTACQIL
jgi:hypothetical protein